jgi:hypothetical protein
VSDRTVLLEAGKEISDQMTHLINMAVVTRVLAGSGSRGGQGLLMGFSDSAGK